MKRMVLLKDNYFDIGVGVRTSKNKKGDQKIDLLFVFNTINLFYFNQFLNCLYSIYKHFGCINPWWN